MARWRGIFKAQEEMGELLQVFGKLQAFPDGPHPDGGPPLRQRAVEEIADVLAALRYMIEAEELDSFVIEQRARKKQKMFREWILGGIPEKNDD